MFSSASECARALRQITSHSALLRQDKHVYSDILSEATPFVASMSPTELRTVSKSILIIHRKFGLNLNNYLFKLINKQLNQFLNNHEIIARHDIVSSMSSLSRIHRQVGDGGPPALRPDTVWTFAHSPSWRPCWQSPKSVMDKSELLSVMSRLNLKPFSHLIFSNEALSTDVEPSAIFFSKNDITDLREEGKRGNGRLIGSLYAMSKLDLFPSPVIDQLVGLVPSKIEDLSPMELGNALHAIGTIISLTKKPTESFEILTQKLFKRIERKRHELPLSVVNQVGLIHYAVPGLLEGGFIDEVIRICESDKSINEVKSSKAQKSVARALDSLGLSDLVQQEYAIGPFRIDFAIPQIKLLLEINGPYHYYYKCVDHRTTKTRMKHKALSQQGFTIIEIDFSDMKEESNRVALLDRRIRAALGIDEKSRRSLKSEISSIVSRS